MPLYVKAETRVELELCGFIGRLFGGAFLWEFLFQLCEFLDELFVFSNFFVYCVSVFVVVGQCIVDLF